jgi:hypothetical protein
MFCTALILFIYYSFPSSINFAAISYLAFFYRSSTVFRRSISSLEHPTELPQPYLGALYLIARSIRSTPEGTQQGWETMMRSDVHGAWSSRDRSQETDLDFNRSQQQEELCFS